MYPLVHRMIMWGEQEKDVYYKLKINGITGEDATRLYQQAHRDRVASIRSLAWIRLSKCLPDYEHARGEGGAKDGDSFALTQSLKSELADIGLTTMAVLQMLKNPAQGHAVPKSTILRLEEALAMTQMLASGKVGSADYDTFMTGKCYALVFDHLLV